MMVVATRAGLTSNEDLARWLQCDNDSRIRSAQLA